jgi:uncharacterized paraquat-inducible protein A
VAVDPIASYLFSMAAVYFGLKVLLTLPILVFDVRLIRKYNQINGKTLYALKLILLILIIAF